MMKSLLDHVQTWSVITNKERTDAKDHFHAPWSNSPNHHITTYDRQLDKRQQDCIKLKTAVANTNKVNYFVKDMYDCGLFESKLLEEW